MIDGQTGRESSRSFIQRRRDARSDSLEARGISRQSGKSWINQAKELLKTWALGRPSGTTFVVGPNEDALLTQVGAQGPKTRTQAHPTERKQLPVNDGKKPTASQDEVGFFAFDERLASPQSVGGTVNSRALTRRSWEWGWASKQDEN